MGLITPSTWMCTTTGDDADATWISAANESANAVSQRCHDIAYLVPCLQKIFDGSPAPFRALRAVETSLSGGNPSRSGHGTAVRSRLLGDGEKQSAARRGVLANAAP